MDEEKQNEQQNLNENEFGLEILLKAVETEELKENEMELVKEGKNKPSSHAPALGSHSIFRDNPTLINIF